MVTSVAGKPHPEQDRIEGQKAPGLSPGRSLDPAGNVGAR